MSRLRHPITRCELKIFHSMTTFNVVISVLSMFILLVKSAMFTLHVSRGE